MCGIAGILSNQRESQTLEAEISSALACLSHRGPDDQGIWLEPSCWLALGQKRLAILDLSPEGHQPMQSASGRFTIVFNGEVYNYLAIQKELLALGHKFRGHSDTEVMLAAFEEWGVEKSVPKFLGMFAFALWDAKEKSLRLVRDRFGVKPLFYGWLESKLVFASELKSFTALTRKSLQIDQQAIPSYLRFGYIPTPFSIYQDIYKLEPGSCISFSLTDFRKPENFSPFAGASKKSPIKFWDPRDFSKIPIMPKPEAQILEEFEALLKDAISLRLISDVPLGAFLSGGIDSSLVVALMSKVGNSKVKTFCIGFEDHTYNEAPYAKKIAEHLGTEHHETYFGAKDALNLVPQLAQIYSEPFADLSALPTLLVSKFARENVTVSLSGDGGDELCSGYARYAWALQVDKLRKSPEFLKKSYAALIDTLPQGFWETTDNVFAGQFRIFNAHEKFEKLGRLLRSKSLEELYLLLLSSWEEPQAIYNKAAEVLPSWAKLPLPDSLSKLGQLSLLDIQGYLLDDILVKLDRASMRYSLEAREPLLDHRLFEFIYSLPDQYRVRNGTSKWLLNKVLSKFVPEELYKRPKQGFGVPIGHWLRNELKDWTCDLLSEERLKRQGLFEIKPIQEKLQQHMSGKYNWQYPLWNILMFQAWHMENT